MEEITIRSATFNGAEGFLIGTEDESAVWMRKDIAHSSDDPLSPNEKLIIALCERVLSLEKKEK